MNILISINKPERISKREKDSSDPLSAQFKALTYIQVSNLQKFHICWGELMVPGFISV